MIEDLFQVQSPKHSKSTSQTESSHHDLSVSVNGEQSLDILSNVALNTEECVVEPLMDQTPVTERVLDLVGIDVDDPVLNAGSASEADDDGIEFSRVASIAEDIEDGVAEDFCLMIIREGLLR